MKISFLCVGKTSEKYLLQGMEEYEKRICRYRPYTRIVIPELKQAKSLRPEQIKQKEGELILAKIPNTAHLILLDEKGKFYSSRKFAAEIQNYMNRSISELFFVVGGAYGFSPEVYNRANGKLSLSPMTFSHQLIRVVFLEQLYRAFAILNNEPYHND